MNLRFSTAILAGIAGVAAFVCPAGGQTLTLDIPEQDLRAALDLYAKITNVQLVYRVNDLSGLKSRGLRGTMDVNVALDRLLEGTGVAVHRDPAGAVVVARIAPRIEPPPPLEPPPITPPAETITVTGYRASLEKALQQKRESTGVRDSILAEDIGKYPASNVAESLARVPGVVIARDTRTDEGKSVTVRGLDASYTIVAVNGNPVRMVTGTSVGNNNRSVDLDAFGADIFSRVDFYKSPRADLDEGGIGGVIDMRTPHPFDYGEDKLAYSLGYSINSYRDKTMPRGTLQASGTRGAFGALVAFTFSEAGYELMGEEAAGWGQSRNSVGASAIGTTFDLGPTTGGFDSRANLGGYTVDQIQQAYVPRFMARQHLELEDRTRYSGVVSLEYQPNQALDVTFDLLGAKLIDKRSEYTLGPYIRSTATTEAGWASCRAGTIAVGAIGCSGIIPLDPHINADNVLYGTFANVGWIDENRWYDGDDRYLSGTFELKYTPNDALKLHAVASLGDNRSFYSDDRLYFYILNTTVHYDPTVNQKFPAVWTDADLTDLSKFSAPSVDANFYREGDRVMTGKLDAAYALQTGFAPLRDVVIAGGLAYVSSQKENDRKSNGAAVKAEAMYQGQLVSSLPLSRYMVPELAVTNFLAGIDHDRRMMVWATAPRDFYESVDMNGILARQESIYPSVFSVTEAVQSVFLQTDTSGSLFGKDLRINAGLRYALTRLWGHNFRSQRDEGGKTFYSQVALRNRYDTLLPSLSIAYDVLDDVVLRTAYGQTLTRPSLANIAQSTTIPVRFNPAASSGNPALLPLHAQNIDVSAEWYFAPDALLSAGIYYKGLKNLISMQIETVPFHSLNLPWSSLDAGVFGTTEDPNMAMQLSRPVNLNPMVVRGFEIFYQQAYGFLPSPLDGLGSLASFTYTAGAASGPGTGFIANDGSYYKKQITGMSTYTFSGTAYYEKGPYSLRLSYSWHSATPAEDINHDQTDMRLWGQARGSLDGTIGYSIDDFLELRLDVTNLLNAPEYQYVTDGTQGHSRFVVPGRKDAERVALYYLHGATYILSFRGRL
jgi:TonB-dependent receptor